VLEGAVLLAAVWALDVLTRLRAPWTEGRRLSPSPARKQTRPGLPDYGEYGRFEWLIYSAYLWLTLGALLWIVMGIGGLASRALPIPPDAARHAIGAGFVTLLILGMAARMLPGFAGKRRVGNPALVTLTAWLGNAAAVARVFPVLVPALPGARILLGLSGIAGWLAVAILGINLWLTFRLPPSQEQGRGVYEAPSKESSGDERDA
jgi:hypothetical protein